MAKTCTRTVRLELNVIGDQNGDKKAAKDRIKQIAGNAWRAANRIVDGQNLNDSLMRTIRERFEVDPSDLEAVGGIEESFQMFFGVKRQATTERDIKQKFPDLPPCVTNPMNNLVVSAYKADKADVHMGNATLRKYKRGMPIPVTKGSVKFVSEEEVEWTLGRKGFIRFKIYFGKDKANHRHTIQLIVNGEKDYGASSFQYKCGKLFLLLSVKDEVQEHRLDPKQCVGVDMGVAVPAYVALAEGKPRKAIGHYEEFARVRMQMKTRRERLQVSCSAARGGVGRKRKLKALNKLRDKERRFVRQYNHFVSRRVIDFAIANNAATINMEFLEGYGEGETDHFVLRHWSYFELQTMIEQKAKANGIKVVKVDPYHTSQICSKCGHYEPGQRIEQKTFKCKKCGEEMNADYNAARNIAQSKKKVTKKEECEFWKQKKEERERRKAEKEQQKDVA